MSFQYEYLTTEDRKSIVEHQIREMEQDHFVAALAREAAAAELDAKNASAEERDMVLGTYDARKANLESRIAAHRAQMPEPETPQ